MFCGCSTSRAPWRIGATVRNIIKDRDRRRIMFVRMDDGAVGGVLSLDWYTVDARRHSRDEVARKINQRADLLP
jgi:hypothetical protein